MLLSLSHSIYQDSVNEGFCQGLMSGSIEETAVSHPQKKRVNAFFLLLVLFGLVQSQRLDQSCRSVGFLLLQRPIAQHAFGFFRMTHFIPDHIF